VYCQDCVTLVLLGGPKVQQGTNIYSRQYCYNILLLVECDLHYMANRANQSNEAGECGRQCSNRLLLPTKVCLQGWLEFNVPSQHKYGYIRDEGRPTMSLTMGGHNPTFPLVWTHAVLMVVSHTHLPHHLRGVPGPFTLQPGTADSLKDFSNNRYNG